ncbi:MAG: RNA 2',3'-cyclic phosphodiesterase [Bacteroidales bacterium]
MEQEYYRTFIALPVKPGKELLTVIKGLKNSLSDERISWVHPDNLHFTLRFLGDTAPDQVRSIGEALRSGIQEQSFTLRMTRPESFGSRKRPRVLYMGIHPSPRMEQIQIQVERILGECGWSATADQPFRAHLTLGRIRSMRNTAAYEKVLDRFGETEPGTLLMDRLVYFRSVLGPRGPVYSPLTEIVFE